MAVHTMNTSTDMKLKERVTINATPDQVWPFVVDPVLQAAWNPKIISIDRPVDGPVQHGDSYNMVTKMSDKESNSEVEVIEVVDNERLVFMYRIEDNQLAQVVTETYELSTAQNGTSIKRVIDLGAAQIPLLIRPLIWLIMTFGKPQGEAQLNKLKRMIESEIA